MKLMFRQVSSCQEQLPGGGGSTDEDAASSIDESLTLLRVTRCSPLAQFH